MKSSRISAIVAIALGALLASPILADGFHCGATAVQVAAWMTSTAGESKEDAAFTTIPDTGLIVRTSRRGDILIHFCAQVDNQGGGRTLLRARVDGKTAEPDLEPATIFSWDQEYPQTRCMDWAVSRVAAGKHTIELQWSNDLGGTSRVSYRSLIVYAPIPATQVTFEPGVTAN